MKLSFLLAVTLVYAQGPPDVVLRSTTRLVQLSVVAQDKSGHPVLDLKKEDFRVLDENQPREIRVFSLNAIQPKPRQSLAGSRVYSNAEPTGPNAIAIIVIDSLNTKWTDQSRATRQLIQFLRQIQPDDHVAVYSLTGAGFQILHDFTRDASDLVTSLAHWNGVIPPLDSRHTDVGSLLSQALQGNDPVHRENQLAGNFDYHNTQATLQAMEAIANSLKSVPGRKNLTWISNGFPVSEFGNLAVTAAPGCSHCAPYLVNSPVWSVYEEGSTGQIHDAFGDTETNNSFSRLVRAMRVADEANLSIYPVEARGLLSGYGAFDSDPVDAQGTQDVMLDIAKKTGGRAFINNNDIAGAIRTAAEDSRVTYTLGFYPETVRMDGRFHRVKISLVDRPGVTLRYREGYIDSSIAHSRKAELEEAFRSPIDANSILLTAELKANNLDLKVDLGSLQLTSVNERHSGEFDILILEGNETGETFGRINDTVVMNFREATYQRFLHDGVPYQRALSMDPKATVLRVVVRDAATGNIGSLTMPVSSPAAPLPR